MQNVLVTGGAGYIGSHACKALAEAGYRPITIDNLCLGHREFVKWGPLIEADIRDTNKVVQTIEEYNISVLMHFAAFAYVGESMQNPAKYFENNILGILSLLAAMRLTNRRKIVFSSTCAVYGSPSTIPITEQTPTAPVNPYGRSKLICEWILSDYAKSYGIVSIILRYFNACGDDLEAGIGENRAEETHLIPRAMLALQGHISDFIIHGDDFPTHDGTAVRDYIHVRDLADAHVLALRALSKGTSGVFNLGIGQGYSVHEILSVIADVSGRAINFPRIGGRRPGDPAALIADASLAREQLGFAPRYSDLRTIVQSAWRWHSFVHPAKQTVE